jgi:hypothetical protein
MQPNARQIHHFIRLHSQLTVIWKWHELAQTHAPNACLVRPPASWARFSLQHFIKIVKAGGRDSLVIKNTFLSNTDNASVSLRRLWLESCNLHAVHDCPVARARCLRPRAAVPLWCSAAPPISTSRARRSREATHRITRGKHPWQANHAEDRYLISSSAIPTSLGGMVRPSALAVLRLTTNSSLVALSTGRSPGFLPLRMRPA